MWEDFHSAQPAVIKPEYLVAAEKLACEEAMLTFTSLYIHLLDQCAWELISAQEMQQAGQELLQLLAAKYEVQEETVAEATGESLLASWKKQFNAVLKTRLAK